MLCWVTLLMLLNKWQLLSCSVTTCQFQNHLSCITKNPQLSEKNVSRLLLHQNNKCIYASSISVTDYFIICTQALETHPTKPRNLTQQDSCQTILTDNPIHSNNRNNSKNPSNRKKLVAITDKLHRRKERCLAFNTSESNGHLQP